MAAITPARREETRVGSVPDTYLVFFFFFAFLGPVARLVFGRFLAGFFFAAVFFAALVSVFPAFFFAPLVGLAAFAALATFLRLAAALVLPTLLAVRAFLELLVARARLGEAAPLFLPVSIFLAAPLA